METLSPQNKQLSVLLRSHRAREQEVAQEMRAIQDTLEARQKRLEDRQGERQSLEKRLYRVRHGLKTGQGSVDPQSQAVYVKRLEQEIEELDKKIQESISDCDRAQTRLTIAEEELLEARVEKKKIERLLQNREQTQRISSVAREEAETDEFTQK